MPMSIEILTHHLCLFVEFRRRVPTRAILPADTSPKPPPRRKIGFRLP